MHRLARFQLADGLRPLILAGRELGEDADVPTRSTLDGVDVIRLPAWRPTLKSPLRNPALEEQLPVILKNDHVDIAHVHHWHNLGTNLCELAAAHGVPSVVTIHDYFATCPWLFRRRNGSPCAADTSPGTCAECTAQRIHEDVAPVAEIISERNRGFRRELECAAARLTISQDLTAHLGSIPLTADIPFECLGFPGPATDIISRSTEVRASRAEPTDRPFRIISWGGLVEGKGMHLLLAACERLDRPVELHHFGRVIQSDYAVALRRDAVRTQFELHGRYDTITMRAEFPGFDLAVFPSLFRETYGIVVDEAMQLGLPVVVADSGAPKERIGKRGLTFPSGDVEALAEILSQLIRAPDRLLELRQATPPARTTMAEHHAALHAIYATVTANLPVDPGAAPSMPAD